MVRGFFFMKQYKKYLTFTFYALLLAWLHFNIIKVFFAYMHDINIPFFHWFIASIRFDISAILYSYAPFYIFSLLPIVWLQKQKIYRSFILLLFMLSTCFSLALNCIDLEYVKFTNRRLTYDFISFLGTGNEMTHQLPKIIQDYIGIVFLFLLILSIIIILYVRKDRKLRSSDSTSQNNSISISIVSYLLLLGLFFIGARGGLQLRPLSIIDAAKYTEPQNTKFILNSCFTFIRSYGKEQLTSFEQDSTPFEIKKSLFTHLPDTTNKQTFTRKNVVLIIVESLSAEYSGFLSSSDTTYTPFLDEMMSKSIVFNKCFANGRRSIDGIPAIIASVPTLMNTAYISSIYSENEVQSFASTLKQKSYHTSFFHGGFNGTMGFESFVSLAGYDHYFGKNQYPHTKDFDGFWGIYDHAFLTFFRDQLNQFKEPFFSTFFSLSSHHPYKLPPAFKKKFPKEEKEILKTIRYVDFSLKEFFLQAQLQPWYKNTVFVFTADHCAPLSMSLSHKPVWSDYHIPFFIYDPSSEKDTIISNVTQQLDILPTTLSYLGYDQSYFAFGNDQLKHKRVNFSITYNNDLYQFCSDSAIYWFDLSNKQFKLHHYHDYQNNNLPVGRPFMLKDTTFAFSLIKNYNYCVINNRLTLSTFNE